MDKRININDLNENRIKQAIDNLTRFHIDKMQVFTANLDDDLEIVLQLIEKQQAELEKLKKDFEIVDHECSRLEQEDIKKDKIINEMAKELYKRGFDIDICDNCSEYNDDCKYIYDCIKQYFEGKIEQ